MDPKLCAQDVMRCEICQEEAPDMRCDTCKIKLCLACSSPHLSDFSKLHLLVPIQIENDEYRMVCDQCSERASMMHCHLYQVSTCSVCAGIHLYNLSQQHIVLTFPNQNTVVDTQDIEINDAVSSQNESRINRLLQCEPCIIQSKKLNSGAIRSLPPSSNTGEWWISFHKNCEDQTMSIKLGPKPDDNTVTKKGNLTYTYLKSKEKNGGAIRSLSLLSNTEVWTGHWGNDIISLHNLREDKTISITLGHTPEDITVTKIGNLIYTYFKHSTCTSFVEVVKNSEVKTVIMVTGWKLGNVCSSKINELLVIMERNHDKQTKVVRYFGSTEKQSIQFNYQSQPLYSSGGVKFITENRNMDICLSDNKAGAVVVVDQAGEHRFTYTGSSTTRKPFNPYDITTDSLSWILIADKNNDSIHILDQNGKFLRFINSSNCDLKEPFRLCIGNNDYLFVAEWSSNIVKKIRYHANSGMV